MCVHRTDNGQCKKYSDNTFTSYCVDGPCPDDMPTNADRIRGMSNEELAKRLSQTFCHGCGEPQLLDWLRQPSETEGMI